MSEGSTFIQSGDNFPTLAEWSPDLLKGQEKPCPASFTRQTF